MATSAHGRGTMRGPGRSMPQRSLVVPVVLALLLIACDASPDRQLEANKDLVLRFNSALNDADWDGLDELLTEGFRRHSQATAGAPVKSREEFKLLQQSFLQTMPDQNVTIEMLVAENDKVAAYATYSGTMTGPMGNLAATGKSTAVKFLSIFRIENGRIAELWVEWDNVAMLGQLGLPPPSQGDG